MTDTGPIHPGEHLADILRDLGAATDVSAIAPLVETAA